MEIERKFLVKAIPEDLEGYPHTEIEQGYLSKDPVVRVRKDGDEYYLTYKNGGKLAHEEYNLPLTKKAYDHLLKKKDGRILTKTRYRIPLPPYTVELDLFHGAFEGLVLAEVEFPTVEEALAFEMPDWFLLDVTEDGRFRNSNLASGKVIFSDGAFQNGFPSP